MTAADLTLADLGRCFTGAIPTTLCTLSGDGVVNVTYLTRVHMVDPERLALSNQFLSKSAQNLREVPRASLLLVDPVTQDEYRVAITYERTERRGPVFERLRDDVDELAALQRMQDVFRLQSADIYRVTEIEQTRVHEPDPRDPRTAPGAAGLGELCSRLGRCTDLDSLVRTAVDGLADLLGYEHNKLLLTDESGQRLFTIASHGYDAEGVGSEVELGDGVIGMVAERCKAIVVGNLHQMDKYSQRVRRTFDEEEGTDHRPEVPLPELTDAYSHVSVPAMAMGSLVGVVTVESTLMGEYYDADVHVLGVVAAVLAGAIESIRAEERLTEARSAPAPGPDAITHAPDEPTTQVRFFGADGSTFLDGEYLIKGVAGRLLWSLLRQHEEEGRTEFTNREVRLDPTLDLPDFRDNFESRLILLKRRLDEREAPIRIEKTGRGRFRLAVGTGLVLDARLDEA